METGTCRWVSVSERLPEADLGRRGVLVLDSRGEYHIATYQKEEQSRLMDWRFWDNARSAWMLPRYEVAYWTELPPIPKQKVKKEGWVLAPYISETKPFLVGNRGWVKVTYEEDI